MAMLASLMVNLMAVVSAQSELNMLRLCAPYAPLASQQEYKPPRLNDNTGLENLQHDATQCNTYCGLLLISHDVHYSGLHYAPIHIISLLFGLPILDAAHCSALITVTSTRMR